MGIFCRKVRYLLLVINFCLVLNPATSNPNNNKRHIYVIDKSSSMAGFKGSPNIWDDVKKAIISNIQDLQLEDEVLIYTFHEKTDPFKAFEIHSELDKRAIKNYINEINANGSYTCTYSALFDVFSNLDTLKTNIIKLYTDGKDSGYTRCGEKGLLEALSRYDIKKGKEDWFFYITLGYSVEPFVQQTIEEHEQADLVVSRSGKPPRIVNIFPKNPILKFSKKNLNWEQAFEIIGKSDLPEDFMIQVESITIPKLTENGFAPSITPMKHSVNSVTTYNFTTLNFNNIPSGIFEGSLVYKKRPMENVYAFILGNKIKIEFFNMDKPSVSWGIKEEPIE